MDRMLLDFMLEDCDEELRERGQDEHEYMNISSSADDVLSKDTYMAQLLAAIHANDWRWLYKLMLLGDQNRDDYALSNKTARKDLDDAAASAEGFQEKVLLVKGKELRNLSSDLVGSRKCPFYPVPGSKSSGYGITVVYCSKAWYPPCEKAKPKPTGYKFRKYQMAIYKPAAASGAVPTPAAGATQMHTEPSASGSLSQSEAGQASAPAAAPAAPAASVEPSAAAAAAAAGGPPGQLTHAGAPDTSAAAAAAAAAAVMAVAGAPFTGAIPDAATSLQHQYDFMPGVPPDAVGLNVYHQQQQQLVAFFQQHQQQPQQQGGAATAALGAAYPFSDPLAEALLGMPHAGDESAAAGWQLQSAEAQAAAAAVAAAASGSAQQQLPAADAAVRSGDWKEQAAKVGSEENVKVLVCMSVSVWHVYREDLPERQASAGINQQGTKRPISEADQKVIRVSSTVNTRDLMHRRLMEAVVKLEVEEVRRILQVFKNHREELGPVGKVRDTYRRNILSLLFTDVKDWPAGDQPKRVQLMDEPASTERRIAMYKVIKEAVTKPIMKKMMTAQNNNRAVPLHQLVTFVTDHRLELLKVVLADMTTAQHLDEILLAHSKSGWLPYHSLVANACGGAGHEAGLSVMLERMKQLAQENPRAEGEERDVSYYVFHLPSKHYRNRELLERVAHQVLGLTELRTADKYAEELAEEMLKEAAQQQEQAPSPLLLQQQQVQQQAQ